MAILESSALEQFDHASEMASWRDIICMRALDGSEIELGKCDLVLRKVSDKIDNFKLICFCHKEDSQPIVVTFGLMLVVFVAVTMSLGSRSSNNTNHINSTNNKVIIRMKRMAVLTIRSSILITTIRCTATTYIR